MSAADDARWMRRAIEVGARGTKAVRPNPRVGCVLVKDGVEIAAGHHEVCGGPHAEANALALAGPAAKGATAYVTLEPCNHWGRTPPCSAALIGAGVARVVIGVRDPHKLASGGVDALQQAGIEVDSGVEWLAARDLAEEFLTTIEQGRAFVRLKLAMSLDGRTSAEDGSSRWITGPEARRLVHGWRAQADAILIGSGTALADDPRLDLRDLPGAHGEPLPLRIVLDRRLRLPLNGHLADTSRQATWVLSDSPEMARSDKADALRRQGVDVACIPSETRAPWLQTVLCELRARGICQVLCEGGATLAGALVRARLCDRLDVLVAPKLLGAGTPVLTDLGVPSIDEALRFRFEAPRQVGADTWLTARPIQN